MRRDRRQRLEALLGSLIVGLLDGASKNAVAEAVRIAALAVASSEEEVARSAWQAAALAVHAVREQLVAQVERHLDLADPGLGLGVRDLEARPGEVDVAYA
jgi:hypothetical protein